MKRCDFLCPKCPVFIHSLWTDTKPVSHSCYGQYPTRLSAYLPPVTHRFSRDQQRLSLYMKKEIVETSPAGSAAGGKVAHALPCQTMFDCTSGHLYPLHLWHLHRVPGPRQGYSGYEENIPAQRTQEKTHTRFQGPPRQQGRPARAEAPPCQGPQSTLRLGLAEQSFPAARRLQTSADFKQVFDAPEQRVAKGPWLALARPGQQSCARLGIVVGKKNVRAAHQRNRLKRQIRESFRCQDWSSKQLDIVVLARKGAAAVDSKNLRTSLQQIWWKLQQTGAHQVPGAK